MALEIGARRLRARANGLRVVLGVVARRARLEQVRAGLVVADDQHADAVRTLGRLLSVDLRGGELTTRGWPWKRARRGVR